MLRETSQRIRPGLPYTSSWDEFRGRSETYANKRAQRTTGTKPGKQLEGVCIQGKELRNWRRREEAKGKSDALATPGGGRMRLQEATFRIWSDFGYLQVGNPGSWGIH